MKNKKILFQKLSLVFALVLMCMAVWAQQTINGTVIDPDGQPLPGVTIVIKGSTQGTVTNAEGEYTLNNIQPGTILQFSFVGMLTREILVGNQTQIDIQMETDAIGIEEVVAVGYGTMRKSDLTGAVTSIKSEDLQVGAINSLEKQLSGKASGVYVVQNSGRPGAGSSIRIRGTNSILGNNEPLYIVDGIPYGNDMGYEINPSDIESVEILKDASSTAIYGARGANGVVIITTKQGKKGAARISFDSYVGAGNLSKKLDLLDASGIAEIHRRAIENGVTQLFNPDEISGKGTDWQDELYRTAVTQNHQLAISGGNDDLNYHISGNYMDEEGIVHNTGYERYALRTNLNSKVTEKLKVGANIYLSRNLQNNSGGYIHGAVVSNPIMPLKDDDGNYTIYTIPSSQTGNPVGSSVLNVNHNNRDQILSNVFGEYEFIHGLKLNSSIGTKITNSKTNQFYPNETFQGIDNISASVAHTNSVFWNSNNTLTYKKALSEQSNIDAMVGFTIEKNRTEFVEAGSNGFITGFQEYHSLESGENQANISNLNEYQLVSFISRINYNVQDKYLMSVSARYDGSSRFSSQNQWAIFPAAAFAWRISNEEFLKDNEKISNLKLRVSAGVSGEQAIPSYQTLSSLGSTPALYAGDVYKIGFYPNRLSNSNLKWEKTQQYDLGIDLGLWDNRLSFTSDIYYKKTTDLLYYKALPKTSGYSSVLSNVGSIENKGVEFSVSSDNLKGEFKWNTVINIALNRNKVLRLGNNPDGSEIERILSPDGAVGQRTYLADQNALIKGEPLGGAYGYIFEGTYKNEQEIANGPEQDKAPGDAKFKDLDKDGTIDSDDRTLISNPNPDYSGGLTNRFSYKGFELSIFMQFVAGNEVFNYTHLDLSYLEGNFNNFAEAIDSWTEQNPNSNIPRAGWDVRANGMNTFHVENGSYLRAKNITLGYNIPLKSINKLKVYISADNAFTITGYSGYNPDVSAFGSNSISSGFDSSVYPLARTVLLGISIEL